MHHKAGKIYVAHEAGLRSPKLRNLQSKWHAGLLDAIAIVRMLPETSDRSIANKSTGKNKPYPKSRFNRVRDELFRSSHHPDVILTVL